MEEQLKSPLTAAMAAALALLLAVVAVGCVDDRSVANRPGHGVVRRVIDGDTVELQIDGHRSVVRLLGVDAPETIHPSQPEQCFGHEASTRLGQLLPVGTEVRVSRDIEARDHFDRLLLYVHLTDGLFVNQWLLDEGLAALSLYEPNTHHRVPLTRAATDAERRGVGLWGSCEGPDQPLD